MSFPCPAVDCGRCFGRFLEKHRLAAHAHREPTPAGCEGINTICIQSNVSDESGELGGPAAEVGTAICIESDASGRPTVAVGTAASAATPATAGTSNSGGAGDAGDAEDA